MPKDEWVLLATLVRPQGRNGEIIAEIFTDFPERFASRRRVYLIKPDTPGPPREAEIENHWLHQGRIVLKFKDVNSISGAEALRGLDVVVPMTERAPLEDDSVYIPDLIGCQLVDLASEAGLTSQRLLGKVTAVERGSGGAADLLVVQPENPAEPELLIPFARNYLVSIDLTAKTITMRLPQGLADLNSPRRPRENEDHQG